MRPAGELPARGIPSGARPRRPWPGAGGAAAVPPGVHRAGAGGARPAGFLPDQQVPVSPHERAHAAAHPLQHGTGPAGRTRPYTSPQARSRTHARAYTHPGGWEHRRASLRERPLQDPLGERWAGGGLRRSGAQSSKFKKKKKKLGFYSWVLIHLGIGWLALTLDRRLGWTPVNSTYLPLQGSMTEYVCSSHSEGQDHKRAYPSSWSHVKLLVTCHSSSQSSDQSKSHGQA